MLIIDINEGLHVSNVGDIFPKVIPPETGQIKTVVINGFSTLKKNSEAKGSITEDGRLKGYFCSKTVFKLSKKILTDTEIRRVLEKCLDFAPIQKTLNELELRKDFEEFSRRMRCKWIFEMNQLIISVKYQFSDLILDGNLLKDTLVWKCF